MFLKRFNHGIRDRFRKHTTYLSNNLLIHSTRSLISSPTNTHMSSAAMPRAKSHRGSLALYNVAKAMMVEKWNVLRAK